MEATNSNSDAVAAGDLRIAKRTASEELEDAPATKRVENSQPLPTISNNHEPKPAFRVPFLEKVCQTHINKDIY
jgi:hypothetical protein